MKKIIIVILIIIPIISMVLLTNQDFATLYTSAIEAISINDIFIPYNLLEQYEGDNPTKKKEAESEIKNICLNILEYPNWQNYLDYIDLKVYKGNVSPQQGDELIVALNFSKDLASICVFSDNGQNYSFIGKIENLLPINEINFVKIPDKEYDFLIAYQTADERLGAFYYENFLEIFMYNNEDFDKMLKETIVYEEIFKSIWIDESSPDNEWIKNMKKNNIIFVENENLYINVTGTKNKYTASTSNSIPKNTDFKLVESSSYQYKYFWNKELERFNRSEDIVTFHNTQGFIVDDSETDNKNLCGFSKNKYKLLTTSGKIIYIDKDFIDDNKNH
ncbi:MAG: hypothetical protein N4A68_16010 [Maledivibacter sp.]|nr:hypothetical protein [Maledivibacter sp.]